MSMPFCHKYYDSISTLKRVGKRRIFIFILIFWKMDWHLWYSENCVYNLHLKVLKQQFTKSWFNSNFLRDNIVNCTYFLYLYFMLKMQPWYNYLIISIQISIDFIYYKFSFHFSNQIKHNFCLRFNFLSD